MSLQRKTYLNRQGKNEMKPQISIGQKFDRLEVLGESHKAKGFTFYLCRCECGKTISRRKDHLLKTKNQSCGCLARELTAARSKTHGLRGIPEYEAWAHMLRRCYTPSTKGYENYGGRGIKVCDRWRHSFVNFFVDMGYRPSRQHSIERIDNNGNYEPSNCRWATATEQANNKRTNLFITCFGKTLTETQWRKLLGVGRGLIRYRIKNGWSPEEALSTPPGAARHSGNDRVERLPHDQMFDTVTKIIESRKKREYGAAA